MHKFVVLQRFEPARVAVHKLERAHVSGWWTAVFGSQPQNDLRRGQQTDPLVDGIQVLAPVGVALSSTQQDSSTRRSLAKVAEAQVSWTVLQRTGKGEFRIFVFIVWAKVASANATTVPFLKELVGGIKARGLHRGELRRCSGKRQLPNVEFPVLRQ